MVQRFVQVNSFQEKLEDISLSDSDIDRYVIIAKLLRFISSTPSPEGNCTFTGQLRIIVWVV